VSHSPLHQTFSIQVLSKVPEGQTAATWDGSGKVWFKTYAEQATIANGQLSWGSLSMYQTIKDALWSANAAKTRDLSLPTSLKTCHQATTYYESSILHCTKPATLEVLNSTSAARRSASQEAGAVAPALLSHSLESTRQMTQASRSTSIL
jgi:hypothetical protein